MDADAAAFLSDYAEKLIRHVAADWPNEVTALYRPERCLEDTKSRQVWLVRDRRTGGRAILRVTPVGSGLPEVYGELVKDGRVYLAEEYREEVPNRPLPADAPDCPRRRRR
ncbi:MAG: hypothetical protein LBO20_02975 [Bifidobacteriaceae bacterium]|jgi:hypothetical protein|nr:hypothetical protein [Bifidobacteriaceae bacterium]